MSTMGGVGIWYFRSESRGIASYGLISFRLRKWETTPSVLDEAVTWAKPPIVG